MDFEQLILSKIIDRDIRLMSRRFSHPTIVLADNPSNKEAIYGEGKTRGYSEDRIRRELNAVIQSISLLCQPHEKPVMTSIELEDYSHLKLGGIIRLVALMENGHECNLLLMRLGRQKFIVLEGGGTSAFTNGSILILKGKDFLSNIDNDAYVFCDNDKDSKLHTLAKILSIATVHDSPAEESINIQGLQQVANAAVTLHKNPMTILLHDYSGSLPHYADIAMHQNVAPYGAKGCNDDLMPFVLRLQANVNWHSAQEVELNYPHWLDYCLANGISVMTLDRLLNLFWQLKERD